MNLVNSTPLPAQLIISELDSDTPRIGTLIAKATFGINPDGTITLDTQDPYPLFSHDVKTELGMLPTDFFPRFDDRFEVILLGLAHSPHHRPVTRLSVAMTIGEIRREMLVFGNRRWEGLQLPVEKRWISQPEPFSRMPLTYERAFGGSAEILIDRDSPILVRDPRNPAGRGFDFSRAAEVYREILVTPEGYPQYPKERSLPNLEDPNHLIQHWDDSPDPVCWAAMPIDSSLHAFRSIGVPDRAGTEKGPEILDSIAYRAHPDWVIDPPSPETVVVLEGMNPNGEIWFQLPPAGVWVDYLMGERFGSRPLPPHMLVILAEDKRFYITYRFRFNFEFDPHTQRSMRIRLDEAYHSLSKG